MLTTVQCPRCREPKLALWCNATSGICDECASELYGAETARIKDHRLLFLPSRSAAGVWNQASTLDFAAIRQYIEACLRPENDQRYQSLRAKTPRCIEGLLGILRSLVPASVESNPAIKSKLDGINGQLQIAQSDLSEARAALNLVRNPRKVANRTQTVMTVLQKIQALEAERETLLSKAKDDIFRIRQHAINRLNRDFELWRQGLLEVFGQTPIRKVHWHLLKPSGNSWEELARHFEQLARIRNERYELHRIKFLFERAPDEIYVGSESFEGYVVFCFNRGETAVLECPKIGNAVYFMHLSNWRFLSKLSKTELLDQHPEVERMVHGDSWRQTLRERLRFRGIF